MKNSTSLKMEQSLNELNENNKSDSEQCKVELLPHQEILSANNTNDQRNKICIEFSDLKYSVKCGKGNLKYILKDVSGCFRPGKLTAILGPSGAGKTSLLNILAGRRTLNVEGSVFVNGVKRSFQALQQKCCYVPQDFALVSLLTVKETLSIAAQLKIGEEHDSDSRKLIVCDVVNKLGMNDCLHTLTGNLSGGEKKRLSIGVEVITNPSVILLDEPTSGLDSTASKQVIRLLHSLAQTGCTVVCTVHQPSSQLISQFDDILVLNQGKCFYYGSKDKMLETFKEAGFVCPNFYNIAEFILEAVTKQREGDLSLLEKLNMENKQFSVNESYGINEYNKDKKYFQLEPLHSDKHWKTKHRQYAASNWAQLRILLKRAMICICRDNMMTKLRLATHVVVALLLGMVFYKFGEQARKVQSNICCLFFFMLFLFFANAMPAVQMFPSEVAVFVRENSNNWYSLHNYYISKVLSDLPLQILCPSSFLIITYFLTGQPCEFMRFFQSWIICLLLTILSQSLGILIGAAFNTDIGMFLVPALNVPMFLFAGFFLKLREMPSYLQWFSTISYFRYAFEGILQAVYGSDRPIFECSIESCISPKRILKQLDMPSVSLYTLHLALIAWISILHISVYLVLYWKLYVAVK